MDTLPDELIVEIMKRVSPNDRISMLCVNIHFNDLGLRYVWKPHGRLSNNIWDYKGKGLLHACHDGHTEYYRKWSEVADEDWNAAAMNHYPGLSNAVKFGHTGIIELILKDDRIRNKEVLNHMIFSGFDKMAKVLMDAGVEP